MLKKRVKIAAVLSCIALVAIVAFILYNIFVSYTDYNVLGIVRTENTRRTNYVKQFSGLLSYNPDGASLIDYDGNIKWNISYEMQDPRIDTEDDYAIVYDRRGTSVEISGKNGEITKIITVYPVTMACVANNGNVAVIMQQPETAYVNVYNSDGEVIAEGRLNSEESGYPLSMSLSSNGEVLAISTLHLAESDVKSDIIFYDFSEEGKLKNDSKSSTFSFTDEVIPLIDYVSGDKLLAIGENHAMVYSSGSEPVIHSETFFNSEIKSTFYNDNYFGIIFEQENENSEVVNMMELYNLGGGRRFATPIDDAYNNCRLLDNNEVFITDGVSVSIYTELGVKKFSCEFSEEIQDMINAGSWGRTYFLLQNGELLRINLT